MIHIAVLLTVYNRKSVTIKGLSSLFTAIDRLGNGYTFDVFMTDDGCTDGTIEAVRESFPKIQIVQGDGQLYWNRGMIEAWKAALKSKDDYDYYIWFNDDVVLFPHALEFLFNTHFKVGNNAIISGAICDRSGKVSYGGWINDSIVEVNNEIKEIDRINGNFVLIPQNVYSKIGMLDHHFHHSYGDFEYGIRAKKNSISLYLTPKYVGECERHDSVQGYYNTKNGLIKRIKNLYSPVGDYPIDAFYYDIKCRNAFIAVVNFLSLNFRCFFPRTWGVLYQVLKNK